MKFIGVTREQLETAMAEVNVKYNGNITFERCDFDHTRRDGREEWNVTLKTRDSKAYGSARSVRLSGWEPNNQRGGRRIPKACWHAHGNFFDALGRLAPEAEMIGLSGHASSPDGKRRCLIREHGWADPYVHNAFSGQYASEMCDCAKFEGDE